MERNREGYFVSETHRECTKCGCVFPKTSKMTLCNKCNCERVKSQSPEWRMHNRCKQRAKKSGMEFDLKVDDIVIPSHCPILGIELLITGHEYGKGHGPKRNSPSLDRIDNSKGYVKGNVQVISQQANKMKSDASFKELHLFAKWICSSIPATD